MASYTNHETTMKITEINHFEFSRIWLILGQISDSSWDKRASLQVTQEEYLRCDLISGSVQRYR